MIRVHPVAGSTNQGQRQADIQDHQVALIQIHLLVHGNESTEKSMASTSPRKSINLKRRRSHEYPLQRSMTR